MNIRIFIVLTSVLVGPFVAMACKGDDKDPPVQTPDPECGNGLLEAGETCEGATLPEGCDPGTCTVQAGYMCLPAPPEQEAGTGGDTGASMPPEWTSTCTLLPVCGNGLLEDGEACDDLDTEPGDGCDASCQIEDGFSCAGEPSDCAACGDGFVDPGEQCDIGVFLGNTSPGCTDVCDVFPGWECFGEPSMCGPLCGDGQWFTTAIPGVTVGFAEGCDDGNTMSGDGCSASCEIESGCDCVGNPPGISTCECGLGDSSGTGSSGGTDSGGTDTGTSGGTTGATGTGTGGTMTTGTAG